MQRVDNYDDDIHGVNDDDDDDERETQRKRQAKDGFQWYHFQQKREKKFLRSSMPPFSEWVTSTQPSAPPLPIAIDETRKMKLMKMMVAVGDDEAAAADADA